MTILNKIMHQLGKLPWGQLMMFMVHIAGGIIIYIGLFKWLSDYSLMLDEAFTAFLMVWFGALLYELSCVKR